MQPSAASRSPHTPLLSDACPRSEGFRCGGLKSKFFAVFLAVGVMASPPARASLLFDRGLPTANLNIAAGANRSNVAWGDAGTTTTMGDSFSLSQDSIINNVTVWVVDNTETPPSPDSYQLWLDADTAPGLGSNATVSNVATSTSVTSVTYAGGSTYQASSSGLFINLYEVSFNLNLSESAGNYAFGVSGLAPTGFGVTTPLLSASNGPLSGSTQMGDDGIIYGFTSTGQLDAGNGYPWLSTGGSSNSTDINIQVFGTAVPEPSSLALLGIGLAGLGSLRRRTRRS